MALRWHTLVVDCRDPHALARWWADVLDWQVFDLGPDEAMAVPRDASDTPIASLGEWLRAGPGILFGKLLEPKVGKNRLHLDLAPHTSQDRDAEIRRLRELGATPADVGQGEEVGWTVLADPEGNEFCVLSSRDR